MEPWVESPFHDTDPLDELSMSALTVWPSRTMAADDDAEATTLFAEIPFNVTFALDDAVALAESALITLTYTLDDEDEEALNMPALTDLMSTSDEELVLTVTAFAVMLSAQIPEEDEVSNLTVPSGADRRPEIDKVADVSIL